MTNSPCPYDVKDLEALSIAHNYHAWIFEEIAPNLVGDVAEIGAGIGDFYDRYIVPVIKRLEQGYPPIIGKNLILIGEYIATPRLGRMVIIKK